MSYKNVSSHQEPCYVMATRGAIKVASTGFVENDVMNFLSISTDCCLPYKIQRSAIETNSEQLKIY